MLKMILIVVLVLVIAAYTIPIMKNPAPDYYTVQGKNPEIDGPNTYTSRVSFISWLKGRDLDY